MPLRPDKDENSNRIIITIMIIIIIILLLFVVILCFILLAKIVRRKSWLIISGKPLAVCVSSLISLVLFSVSLNSLEEIKHLCSSTSSKTITGKTTKGNKNTHTDQLVANRKKESQNKTKQSRANFALEN